MLRTQQVSLHDCISIKALCAHLSGAVTFAGVAFKEKKSLHEGKTAQKLWCEKLFLWMKTQILFFQLSSDFKKTQKNGIPLFTHTLPLRILWRSCSESPKVKENVFLLLNSIGAREAGAWRAAHRAPPWQSRLCCVYPPLSHTLIRLSFSLIENPPQWHSIRAAEWKPGYFYIFFPPTR